MILWYLTYYIKKIILNISTRFSDNLVFSFQKINNNNASCLVLKYYYNWIYSLNILRNDSTKNKYLLKCTYNPKTYGRITKFVQIIEEL